MKRFLIIVGILLICAPAFSAEIRYGSSAGNTVFNDGRYVNTSGDTMTGSLTVTATLSSTSQSSIVFDKGATISRTMKNNCGTTLETGSVVILDVTDVVGTSVTTTAAASNALVFGVVPSTIESAANGLVRVGGYIAQVKVNGTTDITTGDALVTFTTAKVAQKGSYGAGAVFGIALGAYATDDSSGLIPAWIY